MLVVVDDNVNDRWLLHRSQSLLTKRQASISLPLLADVLGLHSSPMTYTGLNNWCCCAGWHTMGQTDGQTPCRCIALITIDVASLIKTATCVFVCHMIVFGQQCISAILKTTTVMQHHTSAMLVGEGFACGLH